jgi:transglutaminase-like putative cysteine protease
LWTSDDVREYQATHAWAEAFVHDLGWVGFDPSNRICPTEAYIRTSVGLDYASAALVRGGRRGSAAETLAVKVKITQAGSDQ